MQALFFFLFFVFLGCHTPVDSPEDSVVSQSRHGAFSSSEDRRTSTGFVFPKIPTSLLFTGKITVDCPDYCAKGYTISSDIDPFAYRFVNSVLKDLEIERLMRYGKAYFVLGDHIVRHQDEIFRFGEGGLNRKEPMQTRLENVDYYTFGVANFVMTSELKNKMDARENMGSNEIPVETHRLRLEGKSFGKINNMTGFHQENQNKISFVHSGSDDWISTAAGRSNASVYFEYKHNGNLTEFEVDFTPHFYSPGLWIEQKYNTETQEFTIRGNTHFGQAFHSFSYKPKGNGILFSLNNLHHNFQGYADDNGGYVYSVSHSSASKECDTKNEIVFNNNGIVMQIAERRVSNGEVVLNDRGINSPYKDLFVAYKAEEE